MADSEFPLSALLKIRDDLRTVFAKEEAVLEVESTKLALDAKGKQEMKHRDTVHLIWR